MTRFFAFGWLKAAKRYLNGSSKSGRGQGLRPARFRPRLEALEDRTVPSILTVTNALDDGSSGTLRSKIAAAAPGDTIQFSNKLQGHTITLTSGQLTIAKNLDIEGPGDNKLIVSGNNASRVFQITGAGTTVTIAGLTIADGRVVGAFPGGGGGGIRNDTTLSLSHVTLANNTAGVGGGVWNNGGTLTVADSTFAGNQAIGAGFFGSGTAEGGGIDNDGTAIVTNSTFKNNLALGAGDPFTGNGAHGGGIGTDGPLTVTGCTFTGNQAIGNPVTNGVTLASQGLGGGILAEGATVIVSNSTFRDNVARGGDGATSPSVLGPRAFIGVGGGMFAFRNLPDPPSTLTMTGCTFEHNQAIGGAGGPGGSGSLALGGGLDVSRTTLTLSGSSFAHNQAIGGAGGSGAAGGDAAGGGLDVEIESTATITNITVAHNQALGGAGGAGANGGNAWGGGLSVATRMLFTDPVLFDGSVVTLSGSTITDNQVDGGHAGLGGLGGNGNGGGVFIGVSGTLTVTGSTITKNHADGGGGTDGLGVGGGVYNLGTFTFDLATDITQNHASTSNDNIFP